MQVERRRQNGIMRSGCKMRNYESITEAFIEVLIEVVKELHESGFIKEQFGKEIPVLIHELEYYEEIAEQNLKANPTELVEEFAKYCNEGSRPQTI